MKYKNYISRYSGDFSTLGDLKDVAKRIVPIQFFAGLFYLICSVLFSSSNAVAIICGFLAITISCYHIYYAITEKKYLILFSSAFILNLSPIWFLYLEAILPGYDAYVYSEPKYRMLMFFYTACFQLFFNLSYYFFNTKITRFSVKNFRFLTTIKLTTKFYFIAATCAFIGPLTFFYFYYGSFDILWTALTAGRSGGGASGLLMQSAIGDESAFTLPVTWVWQLVPVFGAITFVSADNKKTPMAIMGLTMALLVIFNYFLGGSRGQTIVVAAPVIFYFFYYNWDKGLKFWITVLPLFSLAIGVMELQVRYRGNLLTVLADPVQAAKEEGLQSATSFDVTNTHRDNNTYLFCLIIKGVPRNYPHTGFMEFFTILVNPIPRAIWKDKPILIGAKDLVDQPGYINDGPLFMGTTSLTYAVVGEAYLANGLFGIMVYTLFYAILSLFFDGIVYYTKNKDPLTIGILGVSFFVLYWGYRAFFALISILYPIVVLIIFLKFVNYLRKR